jgi:hypothetical protein
MSPVRVAAPSLDLPGDDSSITIDDAGTVRIVYQHATAGVLREAAGQLYEIGAPTQRERSEIEDE